MKINKDSLKAKANNISKELNISQNVVYNRYFYDAFLSRLSKSKYNNQFILKGGLYLSSILGINNRSTMDIDFYIRKISMEKDKIVDIIKKLFLLMLMMVFGLRLLILEILEMKINMVDFKSQF